MNQKRGWIRIAEAVTGVMILAGVLLVVYSQTTERADISESIYNLQNKILKDIAYDNSLRDAVLGYDTDGDGAPSEINDFIDANLADDYKFKARVCDISAPCVCLDTECIGNEIYAEERIISSNLTEYSPRKVRLFVWAG